MMPETRHLILTVCVVLLFQLRLINLLLVKNDGILLEKYKINSTLHLQNIYKETSNKGQ